VVRFRLWLATAVALSAIAGSLLRGQVSNEEEKSGDESGKSQHETRVSPTPTPKKSPKPVTKGKAGTSKSKKKRSASPTPKKSPSPIPKARLATEESGNKTDTSVTPKATETEASPTSEESPHRNKTKPAKRSGEQEEETPRPTETPESTVAPKKSRKSPTPTPKPKGAKKKSRTKKVSSKGKKTAKAKATSKEKETPTPEKTPTPPPEKPAEPSEDSTPPPPRAMAVPTPALPPRGKVPRAAPAEERAQVVIEKSGIEEDQGFEPPPPPPPRRGFWPWSMGRSRAYRYLTSSVIEAIRRAPVKRRRWQFIVVHNSGTRQGNARAFDYYHRRVRRMRNGLAYHFVIGNGTSSGNGQIEIGDRWRRQINGGHVHSDYLNNISLGICLVGDFNRDQPTRAQLEASEELIRYLRERCGKVGMRSIIVRPHREMNPPRWATDCPGDDFPYSWFRRF
jgi:N-acetylmuramoyl-L-alanine amidase